MKSCRGLNKVCVAEVILHVYMYLYPYVYEIIRIDFERNLRKLYTHETSFHGFWKRSKILCNEFEEGPPPPSVWEQNSYRISVKIRRQCIESRTKVTDALQNQRTVISPAQRLPWTIRQLVRGLNGIFKAPRPSMLQRVCHPWQNTSTLASFIRRRYARCASAKQRTSSTDRSLLTQSD